MPQLSKTAWVLSGIGLSLGMPLLGGLVSHNFISSDPFPNVPVHTLIEAAGGLIAIAIAGMLVTERPRKPDRDHYVWMACALAGMGVLDLFHAGVDEGNRFVWLHSTATFVGGVLFACVWLPKRFARGEAAKWLPWWVLTGTILFGIASCLSPIIPAMTTPFPEKEFTPMARGLNVGGGICFWIAGVYFVTRFHRTWADTDWLFAVHTVLFGAAGVLFETSRLWDASWWWWHVLRLLAYMAAYAFAVGAYLSAELQVIALNRELQELNRGLDHEIAARTASLRSSEERYSLAIRGSTDGLWDWNLLNNEVYYSPRFKELIGYQDQEFPNQFSSFREGLHPKDFDGVMRAIESHLQHREPYDVEYRLQTKGGEYRWYRARGQAIWDETGKATRMAGSITDITDRKAAEELLEHERFLFRTLFDHLPDAIYFKDTSGRFTRVSASLARFLGEEDSAAVIGKTDADFFSSEYAAEARVDEQRMMTTGEPMIGKEERPCRDDGRDVWVSTTKLPLHDKDGSIIGTFGISHDITAQKLAQERFRSVIEAAPNAMIVVGGGGTIQFANAAAEQMFQYTREEMIGQTVEMLVPHQLREGHVRHRNDYALDPGRRAMGEERELTGLRKDGELFPIEIGLSPISFDDETVVLSSVYDATKRKQAEDALVTAKEAAESANRAKSEFLANMSHEIRTPMNAIMGMTELLIESRPNRTQAEYLKVVLESAESLLAIINQILDFSKIEAGRLELESIDFDLREVVGDTLKILGHRAHAKKLELVWHIEKDTPQYLCGDVVRLRQILINLVGNAIKFTEDGEVVVLFRCLSSDGSHVKLECLVKDTGIGIAEHQWESVFSAFEQADTSTTRKFGGTGLGLAISKRIVEAMGGEIWIESELEQGTCFHFTINLRPGQRRRTGDQVSQINVSDLTVVVVDDNETNRQILNQVLSNWGMDVAIFERGSQAIEELERCVSRGITRPLLISDVQMPEMDGFMLAEKIRSHEQLKDVPIILLTSGGRSGDAKRCRDLGIEAHLMKPAKHSELLDVITMAAGKRRPAKMKVKKVKSSLPSDSKLRILLVEDGKANQVLAKRILEKWGHVVEIAENGEEAITCWETGEHDLILMDVQMPVMDGIAATRRIRQAESETHSHIPIVAMTAHAMKGDRKRCMEAGMDGYLAKPFRQQELNKLLGEMFAEGLLKEGLAKRD